MDTRYRSKNKGLCTPNTNFSATQLGQNKLCSVHKGKKGRRQSKFQKLFCSKRTQSTGYKKWCYTLLPNTIVSMKSESPDSSSWMEEKGRSAID